MKGRAHSILNTLGKRLRDVWSRHQKTIVSIVLLIMTIAAVVWLGYEFWRLLWRPQQIGSHEIVSGGIDLKMRYRELHGWFAGEAAYGALGADYPSASYVILWPFLGWLNQEHAIWFWGFTTVLALVWLVRIVVRESGAETRSKQLLVALMPLSMYATGATIGNGQLIVHILPALLTGLLLLAQKRSTWGKDLLAATLILLSLVKPAVSAPFFWIVLFVPGRLRPALLVILGYVALTFFAASFQEAGPLTLFREWMAHASQGTPRAGVNWSHGNLHSWLAALGLREWCSVASLAFLAILGIWIYRRRHVDIWMLMGVSGLAARFWTFHLWYDDLLILPSMIALYRVAKKRVPPEWSDVIAGIFLAWLIFVMIAPGGQHLFPPPWRGLYLSVQQMVWIGVLIFLIYLAKGRVLSGGEPRGGRVT
jgi:hypothetical protein